MTYSLLGLMSAGEGQERCQRCIKWNERKFTTRLSAPVKSWSRQPRTDALHSAALFCHAARRWVLVCIRGDKFITPALSVVRQCPDSPEAAAAAGPWQICVYVREIDSGGENGCLYLVGPSRLEWPCIQSGVRTAKISGVFDCASYTRSDLRVIMRFIWGMEEAELACQLPVAPKNAFCRSGFHF